MYVVARDFGFAPNPFHGVCTLATCKPRIRRTAKPGDWVVGMGGRELKATGRCIYFMKITGTMSFEEYWGSAKFKCKKPVRNGSRKLMIGDNIYHRNDHSGDWIQEDSHHSKIDGSPELSNLLVDTSADRVLYSTKFIYFGKNAPIVPKSILDEVGYRNLRNHRTFDSERCLALIAWMNSHPYNHWNAVLADPFQFSHSGARYSNKGNRVIISA